MTFVLLSCAWQRLDIHLLSSSVFFAVSNSFCNHRGDKKSASILSISIQAFTVNTIIYVLS